jgi:hypothetical protein
MKTVPIRHGDKDLTVLGITGREGIWQELIHTVCSEKKLQDNLMKPVHVMGDLTQLGEHTRNPKSGILKRAYHAFPK